MDATRPSVRPCICRKLLNKSNFARFKLASSDVVLCFFRASVGTSSDFVSTQIDGRRRIARGVRASLCNSSFFLVFFNSVSASVHYKSIHVLFSFILA